MGELIYLITLGQYLLSMVSSVSSNGLWDLESLQPTLTVKDRDVCSQFASVRKEVLT